MIELLTKLTLSQKLFLLAAAFTVSFVVFFSFQRLKSELNQFYLLKKQESSQVKIKEEYNNKFRELIKNQERKTEATPVITSDFNMPSLRGGVNIRIVLVRPETVSGTRITPLVNALKKPETEAGIYPLAFIENYLDVQAENYGFNDLYSVISVSEIYKTSDISKVGDFAYLWGKDPFGIPKLQSEFEKVLEENNEDKNQYIIFLYFDDTFEKDEISRQNSFYEYKKFRSFSDPEKKRSYVNVYEFTPNSASKITLVVLHELLHMFGALDKYNENDDYSICKPEGRGNPDQTPALPQKTGDIMCLFVETGNDDYIRGSLEAQNMVINRYTADEIGWVD